MCVQLQDRICAALIDLQTYFQSHSLYFLAMYTFCAHGLLTLLIDLCLLYNPDNSLWVYICMA